jgi:hypothetical protein
LKRKNFKASTPGGFPVHELQELAELISKLRKVKKNLNEKKTMLLQVLKILG